MRYQLRVRTPDGAVVTGTTVIPDIAPVGAGARLDLFNRDRDSLRLTWRDVAGARAYLVRVESPFGAFLLFTDSTHITLKGDLRNYFASSLQRVFIPGFRQRVSVAAVDSNFFDYYRSRNDPFTGSGIINNLEGGIGLFGAAVNISARTLDVVQDAARARVRGPVGRRRVAAPDRRRAPAVRRDARRPRGAQRMVSAEPRQRLRGRG